MNQGLRAGTLGAVITVAAVGVAAQGQKPVGAGAAKSVMHDIIVTTSEGSYTGTVNLTIDRGTVSGDMILTNPTEITAKVAGVSKAGVLSLEFPYTMTKQQCTGSVTMSIAMPPKPGPAKGTMEAFGCGRDATNKLKGTVELTPSAPKAPAK